jgi:hypothetical protein
MVFEYVVINILHSLITFACSDTSSNINTGNGLGFQIGAVIEIGFGVISASMPAMNHILVKTIPESIDSWFNSTIVSKWFGSSSPKLKPSTKSFQEVFSRKIHGLGMHAVEAYDNDPTMGDFEFGLDVDGKGAQPQWEKQGQKDVERQSPGMESLTS